MKRIITGIKKTAIHTLSIYFGLSLRGVSLNLGKYRKLKRDLKLLKAQSRLSAHQFPITRLYPCYMDSSEDAGSIGGHYFHQDLYVAQRIFANKPRRHVDIGSRIDGLVAHVATFREIEVFDIRPLPESVHRNIIFKQADLMTDNPALAGYTDSISCLHALEHFGLGRYGDPICYEGYQLGFDNITGILQPGGKFYFSVPFGPERIEFHAHRIFSLSHLLEMIRPRYEINTFSYVDDAGRFHPDVPAFDAPESTNSNFGCNWGCAIFELTKR
ncbi:MAG: DUF268 domain-containing protein [Tannerellaceae bacterium]|jgi:hypothetical protein|nr:DUF268 domain-containing protein [Tannerellaceae bacterium]